MIIIVIIDPGHGGIECGKGSNIYFNEKDKNLQISRYIYDRMISLGINAYLTREIDQLIFPDERVNNINNNIINNKSNILISNHLGYQDSTNGSIIYSKNTDFDLIKQLSSELNINDTKIITNSNNEDFYYILRESKISNSLIIFYGNTSAIDDLNNLMENWITTAEKVVIAICKYLNVKYEPLKEQLYIIKRSDTLKSISHTFNVSIEDLKKINNLSSDIIFPYGILKLND